MDDVINFNRAVEAVKQNDAEVGTMELSIMSANVRGFSYQARRKVEEAAAFYRPHIIFLPESRRSQQQLLGYRMLGDRFEYGGVLAAVRGTFPATVLHTSQRLTVLELDNEVYAFGVYAPSGRRRTASVSFFRLFVFWFLRCYSSGRPVYVAGDFNASHEAGTAKYYQSQYRLLRLFEAQSGMYIPTTLKTLFHMNDDEAKYTPDRVLVPLWCTQSFTVKVDQERRASDHALLLLQVTVLFDAQVSCLCGCD